MPFEHNLVAISLRNGEYKVHSRLPNAYLDLDKFGELRKIDVSQDNIYQDFLAPFSIWQARRCLPDQTEKANRINEWLDSLPNVVCFVLMHSAEFETGYAD